MLPISERLDVVSITQQLVSILPAALAQRETPHSQSLQLMELCKRHRLSNDDINKEVSDEHILAVYPRLEKWKQVAAHLGLTQEDVTVIEGRARTDEELMRMYMLLEWKNRNQINGAATYQVLLEALLKCRCSNSAVEVCTLLEV